MGLKFSVQLPPTQEANQINLSSSNHLPVALASTNNNNDNTPVVTRELTQDYINNLYPAIMKDGEVKIADMEEIGEALCCPVCEELMTEPRVSFAFVLIIFLSLHHMHR